ncbi:MAG TPA: zinc ribbon domain-containing protein [Actinobacteria bacterium]|nr:zinc ribbon domain-containing protein [Actinomycetes bacterium]HEX21453.1 zinc ribbon domain-containing protein [Actinomycetota bacterium]
MPAYDFKCNACGQEFEKFTTGTLEEANKVCPKCGNHDTVRQFKSSPAVHKSDSSCNISTSGFG